MYIKKDKPLYLGSKAKYVPPKKVDDIDQGLDQWFIPRSFTRLSPSSVVRYWVKTYFDSTGQLPDYSPFAMRSIARRLMTQFEFKQIMKTLYFMSTPLSKYYQYPYGLDCVPKAIEEMKLVESSVEPRVYSGFLGPRVKQLNKEEC